MLVLGLDIRDRISQLIKPALGKAILPPISLEVTDIAEYKNVLGEKKKYQGGSQQQ
jgi:hypothetical protein